MHPHQHRGVCTERVLDQRKMYAPADGILIGHQPEADHIDDPGMESKAMISDRRADADSLSRIPIVYSDKLVWNTAPRQGISEVTGLDPFFMPKDANGFHGRSQMIQNVCGLSR
jgi:hypothetical protein